MWSDRAQFPDLVNQLIDRIGRRGGGGGGGGEEGREGEMKGERHMAGVVEWQLAGREEGAGKA